MILPILAYGDPLLKRMAEEVQPDFEGLQDLIANMYETMYNAKGVGIAAPQVGVSMQIFVVDGAPFSDEDAATADFKRVFINPVILKESGEEWHFGEGCLSIPGIREDVLRPPEIVIEYRDEDWNIKKEQLNGLPARIVQHEYDHLRGVLFTDKLSPLKRKLLKRRLSEISKGDVDVEYRMRFPDRKRQ